MGHFGKQMANREVCNLTLFDYKTKEMFMYIDYANTSTTEFTGETVHAYGGQGHPKKVSFSGDKGGTFTVETQIITTKLLEMLSGGEVSTTGDQMKKVRLSVGSTNTITATGITGLAKGRVWVRNVEEDTTIPVTEVSGNTITVSATPEGTDVDVFYLNTVSDSYNLKIKATSFPKAFCCYGDTIMKTTDDDILPYCQKLYKIVPQTNFSLSFANSGDPGTVTVTFDIMSDDDGNMADLTLIAEK